MEKPTDGQGKQTKAALKEARKWARAGHFEMTQVYIDRAEQFSYVTPQQLRYIQKLLDAARKVKKQ